MSRICLSILFFSASLRFLSTVVNLAMAALMAEKKAISLRRAPASSRVPHSEKALTTATMVSRKRVLPSLRPRIWLAVGTSSGMA
ncbi:hypothetical protein D3C84_1053490 [compost metagenome]